MEGSLNITIKDKNGKVKYKEHLHNKILPTLKNKMNAFLGQLDFLNSSYNSIRYENCFKTDLDSFKFITLHSTPFDDGINHDNFQNLDLEYKIPYLIGGYSNVSDSSNSTYSRVDSALSPCEDIYELNNGRHYLTSTWGWNANKNFTLSSICLRDNDLNNGLITSYPKSLTCGNCSIVYSNSYSSDNSCNCIYYDESVSINSLSKVYLNRNELNLRHIIHPLRSNYVLINCRESNDSYEISSFSDSTGISVISVNNLKHIEDNENLSTYIEQYISYSDLDSTFFNGEYYYSTCHLLYGENYDYIVFRRNDYNDRKGLIRIYRISPSSDSEKVFDLVELSDLDSTKTTQNYNALKDYLYNKTDVDYDYTTVIGNTSHTGYYGPNQFELSIFDKTENDQEYVQLEYLTSNFYNYYSNSYRSLWSDVKYLYIGFKDNIAGRNDAYLDCSFKQTSVSGNNSSTNIYYKSLYPNDGYSYHDGRSTNYLNQTYVNLPNPTQIEEGDLVLISYTISIGGLQDDSKEENN